MNKFLSVFQNIIPFVMGTEAALGNSVPGETKKQLVLQALEGALGVGEKFPVLMVQQISFLIDVIAHVFLRSKAPAAPAPGAPPVVIAPVEVKPAA